MLSLNSSQIPPWACRTNWVWLTAHLTTRRDIEILPRQSNSKKATRFCHFPIKDIIWSQSLFKVVILNGNPSPFRSIDLLNRSSAISIQIGQLAPPRITTGHKQTFNLSALHVRILSRSRSYATGIWLFPHRTGYFLNPRNNHLIHMPVMELSQRYQIISLTPVEEELVARRKALEPRSDPLSATKTFAAGSVFGPRKGVGPTKPEDPSLKGGKVLNG